jgi:hypothetical protein
VFDFNFVFALVWRAWRPVFGQHKPRAAVVTFVPAYDSPQLPGAYLALATATTGATVHYTTDGNDPVRKRRSILT